MTQFLPQHEFLSGARIWLGDSISHGGEERALSDLKRRASRLIYGGSGFSNAIGISMKYLNNNVLLCKQELMTTSAHRLIQDQNLNILYNGAKMDMVKSEKKGRVTGRKALNDISNSRKLPTNVISIEKDPVAVAKAKLPKTTEKGKVGGRKALSDVTNSVKSTAAIQGLKIKDRKLGGIAEEGFLHNHQECVKAKGVDVGYFLKSVGLSNGIG